MLEKAWTPLWYFLPLAAPLDLALYHLENVRINDGFVVSLDIVLWDLTLVDLCLLDQEADRVGFLQ